MTAMMFAVYFSRDIDGSAEPALAGAFRIDAEDLHAVVRRVRLFLSVRGFGPGAVAFRIFANNEQVFFSGRAPKVTSSPASPGVHGPNRSAAEGRFSHLGP